MRLLRVLVALGLVVSGCTFGSKHPRLVTVELSTDEATLLISLDTCKADLTAWKVETEETVTIEVTARNDTGLDCSDGIGIDLNGPLGDRTVINGPTGEAVEVRRLGD